MDKSKKTLYDGLTLYDYDVRHGDTLNLETWDGYVSSHDFKKCRDNLWMRLKQLFASYRLYMEHLDGSRTTSRRDCEPKGLQAEIKTLQAPQNTILSSVKRYFSKILASLAHNKGYS